MIDLIETLRERFGRPSLSRDDSLRLDSIRHDVQFQSLVTAPTVEKLLSEAEAVVAIDLNPVGDSRAFDLVNKTNQFNLNGIRYTYSDWAALVRQPNSVLFVVGYEDRFGPLGKVAVVRGQLSGSLAHVTTWVMSCRAFSRRIEFQTLRRLFDVFRSEVLHFDFHPTEKNVPLQNFFASILGSRPREAFTITRSQFDAVCPTLYHRVSDLTGVFYNND